MAGGRWGLRRITVGAGVATASVLSACAGPTERADDAPAGFAAPDAAAVVPFGSAASEATPTVVAGTPPPSAPVPTSARVESAPTTAASATSATPAPSVAPITAPPTTIDPDVGNVTMAFTGDALWHSPLWGGARQAFASANGSSSGYDFAPMLAGIAPIVSAADLAVCHLETPIAPEGEGFTTFPDYGVPPEVAPAIAAAGFDRCSTASNHVLDRGVAGVDRTVNVLLGAGLGVSGMARTPTEIEPAQFVVDGVSMTHLSYTYGYNGKFMPAGEEWRSALIDPDRIIADARTAEALGAELVIVSLHWGVEGSSAITPDQRRIAEQLTASGSIDLIVGHHAHVLQPIEQVNGVWVIYGLGNMISNMPTGGLPQAATQDGAVATIEFRRRSDGGFDVTPPVIYPTWVDRAAGWVVRPVLSTLADPATPQDLHALLEASLSRTTAVLGPFVATY